MKNILLILLLNSSLGYSFNEVKRTFGLFGGLALSSMSYSPSSTNSSSRTGVNLGLDFELPLTKNIFIVPSFYAAQKGEETSLGTVRLDYIEVALTPKYKTSSDATGFYFLLGPYLASILSRSTITKAGAERNLSSEEVKNTEAGILGGLGFELPVSHHWTVYVEGRYSMGISRALEIQQATNNAIMINLGFHYRDREDFESNYDRAVEFVRRKSSTQNADQKSTEASAEDLFSGAEEESSSTNIGSSLPNENTEAGKTEELSPIEGDNGLFLPDDSNPPTENNEANSNIELTPEGA